MKNWVQVNRYVSWFFAVGYVLVHYIWPLRHGEGDLMTMDLVPRTFFMISFVWMTAHAVLAWRLYGFPSLRPRNFREVYILGSWLVLLITTPIFSVPALGASPLLMAIAWPPLAFHLAMNAWHLCGRLPWRWVRASASRMFIVLLWLAWIAGAAVKSFPHF